MTSTVLTWTRGSTLSITPAVVAAAAIGSGGRRQLLVTLAGELDVGAAFEMGELLRDMTPRPPTMVVFDAAAVTFLDATGLNALLVTASCLRAGGHQMCLRRPSAPVRQLLVSTGTAALVGLDGEALARSDRA